MGEFCFPCLVFWDRKWKDLNPFSGRSGRKGKIETYVLFACYTIWPVKLIVLAVENSVLLEIIYTVKE